MQSPGSRGTRYASTPEIEGVFSLAADPQLAENSRQGSERKNRPLALGFAAVKSQTTQWGSWQASGRTAAGPTVYLYDGIDLGSNIIEELDNSGNALARYTHGSDTDQPFAEVRSGTTSYYDQDGIGSITALSNSAGALANTYTYDSFGKSKSSTGTTTNPFRYTGRELDSETGIYYFRARYYDPAAARFLNEDPIGFEGGINFYPYVLNNPLNLRDPNGQNAGAIAVPVSEGIAQPSPCAHILVFSPEWRSAVQLHTTCVGATAERPRPLANPPPPQHEPSPQA